MSKTTNLLLATLGAAAVGVVAGILLAPDKGSNTRKKINKKTHEAWDYLADLVLAKKEEAEDAIDDALDAGEKLAKKAEDKLKEAKAQI